MHCQLGHLEKDTVAIHGQIAEGVAAAARNIHHPREPGRGAAAHRNRGPGHSAGL
jgi:hypothetical protein